MTGDCENDVPTVELCVLLKTANVVADDVVVTCI